MELLPYREWLGFACRYCETHPPERWSVAGINTVDPDAERGLVGSAAGSSFSRRAVRMRGGKAKYLHPNSFDVKEYVSKVAPFVYTVKVIRKQYYADGSVSHVSCCAKGKSKKSSEVAYEQCCRKMLENFGLMLGSKSIQEAVFKMIALDDIDDSWRSKGA